MHIAIALAVLSTLFGSAGGGIRKELHILRTKIGKNDTPSPDHEGWLRYDYEAFAETEWDALAHSQRIDLVARG
jgi:hypothetical protein